MLTSSQETKDRTFHELDILFAKQVPARKFATTDVNAFDEHETNRLAERYSVAGQVSSFISSTLPSVCLECLNAPTKPLTQSNPSLSSSSTLVLTKIQPPQRPSFVPSVTNILASHGRAEDAAAQRRGSVAGADNTRRPSIAPAVTDYLKHH